MQHGLAGAKALLIGLDPESDVSTGAENQVGQRRDFEYGKICQQ